MSPTSEFYREKHAFVKSYAVPQHAYVHEMVNHSGYLCINAILYCIIQTVQLVVMASSSYLFPAQTKLQGLPPIQFRGFPLSTPFEVPDFLVRKVHFPTAFKMLFVHLE